MRLGLQIGGGALLFIALIMMFAVWMNHRSAQDFLRNGVAAKATVLNVLTVEDKSAAGNDYIAGRTIHAVRAGWKTPSGQAVEALSNESIRPEDQAKLRVGGPVDVLYRADNPQSFMLRLTAERVANDPLPFKQAGFTLALSVLLIAASFAVGRRRATL